LSNWALTDKVWVYTQAGCDHYAATFQGVYEERLPGTAVPEHYRQRCPQQWVDNGWVEEGGEPTNGRSETPQAAGPDEAAGPERQVPGV